MRLADRLVPAQVALFDESVGLARTQMIGTLAELGVADELAKGPATAEELAGRLGVNADALHRVMRAASLIDLFGLDRGRPLLARAQGKAPAQRPSAQRARLGALLRVEVQLGRLGGPDRDGPDGEGRVPRASTGAPSGSGSPSIPTRSACSRAACGRAPRRTPRSS